MSDENCSITSGLQIVPGSIKNYKKLSVFHYRSGKVVGCPAIYCLVDFDPIRSRLNSLAGVIVYAMPVPSLELRNIATQGIFTGLSDRRMHFQMVNNSIRTISRVIIDPRYRGLGLAAKLVRETMGKLNVPIIESMAVMGRVNPFFEKAGMKAYKAPRQLRVVKLIAALGHVGIEENMLIDPEAVHCHIEALPEKEKHFIIGQFNSFIQAYGKQRSMTHGPKRTAYILSKLTHRPAYFIWFNPEMPL